MVLLVKYTSIILYTQCICQSKFQTILYYWRYLYLARICLFMVSVILYTSAISRIITMLFRYKKYTKKGKEVGSKVLFIMAVLLYLVDWETHLHNFHFLVFSTITKNKDKLRFSLTAALRIN